MPEQTTETPGTIAVGAVLTAARVLAGWTVKPGTEFVITPAVVAVYTHAVPPVRSTLVEPVTAAQLAAAGIDPAGHVAAGLADGTR